MTSPADEMATVLDTAGHGTRGASSGWGLFINKEPASPDTSITIYDTPGMPPDPKWSRDFPRFQVRVRGAKNAPAAAMTKAEDIRAELLGKAPFAVGGINYVGLWITIDTASLGYDEANRPLIIISWRAIREPPASGNRE